MGIKRIQLINLLEPNNPTPSLSYWTSILTFFELNINDLDIQDMEILCAESEHCRKYQNTDKVRYINISRNGYIIEFKQIDRGLDISKENVFPKIYDHLAMLKQHELEEEEYHWSADFSSKHTNNFGVNIPLAAAPK